MRTATGRTAWIATRRRRLERLKALHFEKGHELLMLISEHGIVLMSDRKEACAEERKLARAFRRGWDTIREYAPKAARLIVAEWERRPARPWVKIMAGRRGHGLDMAGSRWVCASALLPDGAQPWRYIFARPMIRAVSVRAVEATAVHELAHTWATVRHPRTKDEAQEKEVRAFCRMLGYKGAEKCGTGTLTLS